MCRGNQAHITPVCWHNCANIHAWLRCALRWIWLLIGLLSLWFAVVVWVTSLGPAFHRDKTVLDNKTIFSSTEGDFYSKQTVSPLKRRLKLKLFHFQLLSLQSINKRKKMSILTPGWLTQIQTVAEVISWLTDTDQNNRQGWGLCNTLPNVYILHNDIMWWTEPVLRHG